ncbi:MAG: BamA/TamA family outer membrane protein [Chitinivibrionia bacterium]|nr:BamA/TamA family outer membrane protein [Chitinivibrionia bacterium]
MKPFILYALIALIAFPHPAWGGAQDHPDSLQNRRNSLVALPYAFYTPETKVAFGAGSIYSFRSADSAPDARPSNVRAAVTYTVRNQIILALLPELYFKNERYYFTGYFGYYKYPDKFWGIGGDAPDSAEEDYEPVYFKLQSNLQKRVLSGLYVGIRYQYEYIRLRKTEESGVLRGGTVPGAPSGSASGLGIILNHDTRDHLYRPSSGFYNQAFALVFRKALGSDYTFTVLSVDLRRYFSIFGSHVLAFQTYDSFISGSPPFQMLNMFGSSYWMRGFYFGRYRDKHMITCQAEYRLPVWWRFGAVGFAGLGDVSDRVETFRMNHFKYCFGAGVRFMFDAQEKINARVDVGYGNGGNAGIYVLVLAAI